jgi:sugar O-acyltransferase (sialic acid O-acetyltransferase NeuD family)
MITILGKSEATLTFVADNMAHRASDYGQIIHVINNLAIPDHLQYKHPAYSWKEAESIQRTCLAGFEHLVIHRNFVLGVYQPKEKVKAFSLFQVERDEFINAIHKSASISLSATIGRGILMNANATIAGFSKIGDFVSINRNAAIGHHVIVEDFVTINPSVSIGGNCRIGEATTIGMGAVILDGVSIGRNCIIGAGSVVTKDVPDNTKGFGVPFAEK